MVDRAFIPLLSVTLAMIVLMFASNTLNAQTVPGQPDTTKAGDTVVVVTQEMIDAAQEKFMSSREVVGWHEIAPSFQYAILDVTTVVGDVSYTHRTSLPVLHLEYRYCFLNRLTIGARIQYADFDYGFEVPKGFHVPRSNQVVTGSILLNFRSEVERTSAALILYSGYSQSYLRMYAATIVDQTEYPDGATSVIYNLPDATDSFGSIPVGIGYESRVFYGDIARFRLFLDFLIPLGGRALFVGGPLPVIGLGFSW